jgi:hypothetical protein
MNKTRRVIETLNFRLYFKVIRQNSSDRSLSDNDFEISVQVKSQDDLILRNFFFTFLKLLSGNDSC